MLTCLFTHPASVWAWSLASVGGVGAETFAQCAFHLIPWDTKNGMDLETQSPANANQCD